MKRPVAVMVLSLTAACQLDGAGPDARALKNIQISFSTTTPTQPVVRPDPIVGRDTIAVGTDTLIVESAEIVVKEVELKRVDVASCSSGSQDGCEEFEAGPFLVVLPTSTDVVATFELDVPAGEYSQLKLTIHRVSQSDEEDAAFRNVHPEFAGISLRVTGHFNGQPFTYTSSLEVEQELRLDPHIVVDSTSSAANITVRVGLDEWFRDSSGALLDPASGLPGGPNASVINENIKRAIEAFEDDDRDGRR